MTVAKKELLGQLKHQETAFQLSLGMLALVQTPAAMRLLRDQQVYVTNAGITNCPDAGSSGFTFDFVNCEGLADSLLLVKRILSRSLPKPHIAIS